MAGAVNIFKSDYLFEGWGLDAGALVPPELPEVLGKVLVVLGLTSLTCVLTPFGINTVEKRQSRTTIMASSQVPFSNISVVCFTPMN